MPNPETMEEIEQPTAVAVTDEHELVCRAIDACDEYIGDLNVEPEQAFLCPLSHTALRAPVSAPDGYAYEKTYIDATKKAASIRKVQWCSPMTRDPWTESTQFPDNAHTVAARVKHTHVSSVDIHSHTPLYDGDQVDDQKRRPMFCVIIFCSSR